MEIGDAASVAYIDLQQGKVLERFEMPKRRFNAGHIAVASNGQAAVVSAPRDGIPASLSSLGAVSVLNPQSGVVTLGEPREVTKRMAGEALSLAIDENENRFAVTHPDGNMISFWSLDSGTFCGTVDSLIEPRGVVVARQPGSTTVVAVFSMTMAGPSSR